MEDDLISKKELLQITNISYGQLYRWKRKDLIPEEWFIKKSSFTGQETFFPKVKILERINKIKSMKDKLSLDEISDMFKPNYKTGCFRKGELIKKNIIEEFTFSLYSEIRELNNQICFKDIFYLYLMQSVVIYSDVSIGECNIMFNLLDQKYDEIMKHDYDICFIRKLGLSISLLIEHNKKVFFDDSVKLVFRKNLTQIMDNIKYKINQ